jgi:hypothetical protein
MALWRLILAQRLAVLAQQKMGFFQALPTLGQFVLQSFLNGAIGGSVVFLSPAPAYPHQHPHAIGFKRKAVGDAAQKQDFFRTGIADVGELLERLFRLSVGPRQNGVEVPTKLT